MKKHGFSTGGKKHPIYHAWGDMKQRCSNPKCPQYKDYGGRGITVCDRWMKFENFKEDMLSTWKPGLQLDRTNNNGNYEPANCMWVTPSVNGKNRRCRVSKQSKYPGVTWNKHVRKWAVRYTFDTQEEAEVFYEITATTR
ncbi:MAG TPA: hypothetical protein VJ044_15565 [Candidatus Hodarchaeales archaeon]|nr:hypothetical protein [Candidatus Hodarchaeales archaeon]